MLLKTFAFIFFNFRHFKPILHHYGMSSVTTYLLLNSDLVLEHCFQLKLIYDDVQILHIT